MTPNTGFHTLGWILANPEDFKFCTKCNAVNILSIDHCHECGDNDFRPYDDEDDDDLVHSGIDAFENVQTS